MLGRRAAVRSGRAFLLDRSPPGGPRWDNVRAPVAVGASPERAHASPERGRSEAVRQRIAHAWCLSADAQTALRLAILAGLASRVAEAGRVARGLASARTGEPRATRGACRIAGRGLRAAGPTPPQTCAGVAARSARRTSVAARRTSVATSAAHRAGRSTSAARRTGPATRPGRRTASTRARAATDACARACVTAPGRASRVARVRTFGGIAAREQKPEGAAAEPHRPIAEPTTDRRPVERAC